MAPVLRGIDLRYHHASHAIDTECDTDMEDIRWLRLDLNDLATLPAGLDRMKHLQHLSISSNTIHHLPNDRFHHLPHLLRFNASRNNLCHIPPALLHSTSLRSLNLSSNHLHSFPHHSNQHNQHKDQSNHQCKDQSNDTSHEHEYDIGTDTSALQLLVLNDNAIRTIPADVFLALPNLVHLSMANNCLSNLPRTILNCPRLTSLNLSGNPLAPSALHLITSLHALKHLDLSNLPPIQNETPMARLTTLPSSFSKLTHLTSLNLSHLSLSHVPLPILSIPSLLSLNLSNNNITDLSFLSSSSSSSTLFPFRLRFLCIASNLLTDASCLRALNIWKDMEVLDLRHNHIVDVLPIAWIRMVKLRKVRASGNNVRTIPWRLLARFLSLKEFELEENNVAVSEEDVEEWKRFEKVVKVDEEVWERVRKVEREKRERKMRKVYRGVDFGKYLPWYGTIDDGNVMEEDGDGDDGWVLPLGSKSQLDTPMKSFKLRQDTPRKSLNPKQANGPVSPQSPTQSPLVPPALDYSSLFPGPIGSDPGLFVFCIRNFRPVLVPNDQTGTFNTHESYIILNSSVQDFSSNLNHVIYYWIGHQAGVHSKTSTAMLVTSLRTYLSLSQRPIRIVENEEPDDFKTLFLTFTISHLPPSSLTTHSVVTSVGTSDSVSNQLRPRLFHLPPPYHTSLSILPPFRSSLRSENVYLLETPTRWFVWFGASVSKLTMASVRIAYGNGNARGSGSGWERDSRNRRVEFIHEGSEPDDFLVSLPITETETETESKESKEERKVPSYHTPFLFELTMDPLTSTIDLCQPYTTTTTFSSSSFSTSSTAFSSTSTSTSLTSPRFRFSTSVLEPSKCIILDTFVDVFVWVGKKVPDAIRRIAYDVGHYVMDLKRKRKNGSQQKEEEGGEGEGGGCEWGQVEVVKEGWETRWFWMQFEEPVQKTNVEKEGNEDEREEIGCDVDMDVLFRAKNNETNSEKDKVDRCRDYLVGLKGFIRKKGTFVPLDDKELGIFYREESYAILASFEHTDQHRCICFFWKGKEASDAGWATFQLEFRDDMAQLVESMYGCDLEVVYHDEGDESIAFHACFDPMVVFQGKREQLSEKSRWCLEIDTEENGLIKAYETMDANQVKNRIILADNHLTSYSTPHDLEKVQDVADFLSDSLKLPRSHFKTLLPTDYPTTSHTKNQSRLFRCSLTHDRFHIHQLPFRQSSLDTHHVFLVLHDSSAFIWRGLSSPERDYHLAVRALVVYLLNRSDVTSFDAIDVRGLMCSETRKVKESIVTVTQFQEGEEFKSIFGSWDDRDRNRYENERQATQERLRKLIHSHDSE